MSSFLFITLFLIVNIPCGKGQTFSTHNPGDLRKKEIEQALQKGTYFLNSIQRADGAICDTINPLFDTWETVLAATALYESTGDTNNLHLKHALHYLRLHENSDGLICHNKKCRAAYCLETTAMYFRLLSKTGQKETVRTRAETILTLQKPGGEWLIGNPDVREQKDFPSVTGFVLSMLQEAGLGPMYKEKAVDWLLNKQTAQGDWGAAWEYYDCPAYALWPILRVLKDEHTPAAYLARQKAAQYIISQQNSDGSWDFKNANRAKRPSPELQTALMLSALAYKEDEEKETIDKAIDFLLSHQQNNGGWDGGYFPIDSKNYEKKEYVFATAQAMVVLQNYLHR